MDRYGHEQLNMHLYLGGHLNQFDPLHRVDLELEVLERQSLRELLSALKIPAAEVFLVIINGEAVPLNEASVQPEDRVKLYSPVGGG
mgnify:CR=1 FL=1